MKLFRADDIKSVEMLAASEGLTLERMMENAGNAAADFMKEKIQVNGKSILILCGKGNNGGDGFVAANRMSDAGAEVTILLTHGYPKSDLAQRAFGKLYSSVSVVEFTEFNVEIREIIIDSDIILDAMFGFSFHGEITGPSAELLEYINENSTAFKVSVDLPSGVVCDDGYVGKTAFRADYTVTFSVPKPAFFLYPGKTYCSEFITVQVGIRKEIIDNYETGFCHICGDDIKKLIPDRKPVSNKGSYGRLLMICGSYGMIGACIMASKAALRCGVGLLNIAVTDEIYKLIAPQIPEAVFTIIDRDDFSLESDIARASAVVCGCGLGSSSEKYVELLLRNSKVPVVFDADALNYLSTDPDKLNSAEFPIVITPHPGEMSRLCKSTISEIQGNRLNTAVTFSRDHGVITVLKGSGTIISDTYGCAFLNTTGNSGLSKGGSGDVLAGMIGSFMAQGVKPIDAAKTAVYLHGKAADIAAEDFTEYSLQPTDLLSYIPEAFKSVIQ